jgi:hypothetical protein
MVAYSRNCTFEFRQRFQEEGDMEHENKIHV